MRSSQWAGPILAMERVSLLANDYSRDAARLNSTSMPESAALFACVPSTRERTRLSDSAITCAIGLRLWTNVAAVSKCPYRVALDPQEDHALCCHFGNSKHARHAEVNARIKRALADAGVAATLEPVGSMLRTGSTLMAQ